MRRLGDDKNKNDFIRGQFQYNFEICGDNRGVQIPIKLELVQGLQALGGISSFVSWNFTSSALRIMSGDLFWLEL